LFAVAYNNGEVIIDVGWYPSRTPLGAFKVNVVECENFDNPIKSIEGLKTFDQLVQAFRDCIEFVRRRTNGFNDYPDCNISLDYKRICFTN
jgi:hypothetical protein